MSERGPDPVVSAMAGTILGVDDDLADPADVYGQMYAEAYWRAFEDLKGRVGSDVAAGLGEDFQVLFYVFSKRRVEQRVGVIEVDCLSEDSDVVESDSGRLGPGVCA